MFCLCDLCRPMKFSPCRAKRASAWHAAAMEFSKVSSTRSCFKKCSDVVLWHTRVVWICLDRTFMKFDWPQWQGDGLASEHLSQSIAYRDSCQVDNCDVQERKVDLLPLHCPVDSYIWFRYQSFEVVKTHQDQEPAATNATRPMVTQAVSASTPSHSVHPRHLVLNQTSPHPEVRAFRQTCCGTWRLPQHRVRLV